MLTGVTSCMASGLLDSVFGVSFFVHDEKTFTRLQTLCIVTYLGKDFCPTIRTLPCLHIKPTRQRDDCQSILIWSDAPLRVYTFLKTLIVPAAAPVIFILSITTFSSGHRVKLPHVFVF